MLILGLGGGEEYRDSGLFLGLVLINHMLLHEIENNEEENSLEYRKSRVKCIITIRYSSEDAHSQVGYLI